ncbi:uncharacterized protein F4812DRAFT_97281 [Daldinia caldariorum]|uniref:uncharacterized protein n=1 Tax=Daldinia caldariorum TaxID=326644 RepID=UPI0020074E5A|nr:uncharacterized protein F4812DRAFT_97281 [Daldinia caldariorum]KAI1466107.1 hypothetical protein F4812DRAFT_97281 [Daldinia caldariorum]
MPSPTSEIHLTPRADRAARNQGRLTGSHDGRIVPYYQRPTLHEEDQEDEETHFPCPRPFQLWWVLLLASFLSWLFSCSSLILGRSPLRYAQLAISSRTSIVMLSYGSWWRRAWGFVCDKAAKDRIAMTLASQRRMIFRGRWQHMISSKCGM